jgi:uncharacterized protein (TIGR02453 family)
MKKASAALKTAARNKTALAGFEGIPPGATRLLVELAHRQDKLWYQEHKPELEATALAPLRALVESAAPALRKLYPRLELTPKSFRLHRDVRFSKDKSPFKDHAAAVVMVGTNKRPGSAVAALYLQLGLDEGGAAGLWSMEPEQLLRFRKAVLHERHGARLVTLLRAAEAKGHRVISAAQLSRAPRGVEPDHPRLALLRRKGLALDFPAIPAKVRHSKDLLAWCSDRAREAAPTVRWILEHCA